eukprot:scaffold67606_cov67-Phaeocystis_antarctica.AAC.1
MSGGSSPRLDRHGADGETARTGPGTLFDGGGGAKVEGEGGIRLCPAPDAEPHARRLTATGDARLRCGDVRAV